MNQFASQEQALAHAQRLAAELSEALREAIKGAGPAEMDTRGTIPEGSTHVGNQTGSPVSVLTHEDMDLLRQGVVEAFLKGSDRGGDVPNGLCEEGQKVHHFDLFSSSKLCQPRRDVLVKGVCNGCVAHDSSSSVGDAPAVTGADSSASDPTEEDPPSLADLADDLSRVVEGLRRLSTGEAR